jgi:hypothetical protein
MIEARILKETGNPLRRARDGTEYRRAGRALDGIVRGEFTSVLVNFVAQPSVQFPDILS